MKKLLKILLAIVVSSTVATIVVYLVYNQFMPVPTIIGVTTAILLGLRILRKGT